MKIIGTGSALPKKVVTNDMLTEFLTPATNGYEQEQEFPHVAYLPTKVSLI